MTRAELLDRIDIAVSNSLGLDFAEDQQHAVRTAIASAIAVMIDLGAISVPRFTPRQEATLRQVEREAARERRA